MADGLPAGLPPPGTLAFEDVIISLGRSNLYPRQAWYCLGIFIFVGMFPVDVNSALQNGRDAEGARDGGPCHGSSLARMPLAFVNAYRVIAFRWTLNIGKSYTISLAEVFVGLAYIALLITWLLINTTDVEGQMFSIIYWSGCTGILAASQFPLITALGTKNSLVSLVAGVSYEKLNTLHRIVVGVCIVSLWVHAASESHSFPLKRNGNMVETRYYGIGHVHVVVRSVLASCASGSVRIVLLSPRHLRLNFPYRSIFPHFTYEGLDRSIRLVHLIPFNYSYFGFGSKLETGTMDATTELLADNVVRLRLRRPPHFHGSAGQTAYLIIPSVSRLPFEAHPFTIASIDSSSPVSGKLETKDDSNAPESGASFWKELVFIINVRKGFTKRLGEIAANNGKVKVFVDGPYGFPPNLSSYDTSVLVV
ncbi:hypothetical protein BJ138DRAFT_1130916, partial [Hygrophoropsis aurantiaca]